MRISEKDRRALGLLGGFGLLMALWLLILDPSLDRLDALARQRALAEEALAKGERERRLVDPRQQRLREARAQLDAAVDRHGLAVPPGRRTGETIAGLRRAAQDLGVSIVQVRPMPVAGELFAGVALDAECAGPWEATLRLIHHLETAPELTLVERVELSRPEGQDVRTRLRIVRWFRAQEEQAVDHRDQRAVRSFQVATTPTVGAAPLLLAEQLGRLRTDGVAWELMTGPASEVLAHLRSGDAEAAVVHAASLLTLQADGVPVVAVAALSRERSAVALVVHPQAGVADLAGLAGHSVAVLPRESGHFWLFRLCRDQGLDINRLRLSAMPMLAGANAIIRREVDAAMLRDPWLDQVVQEGAGRILAEPRSDDIRSWILLVTTRRMAEEQPEAVRRLVAGVIGVRAELEAPGSDALLSASLWQSSGQIAALRSRVSWVDLAENRLLLGGSPAPLTGDLAPFAEFLETACSVSLPAEALGACTDRFLPEASDD